jgi:hypothetical protein
MQVRVAYLDCQNALHFGFRLLNLVENALHKSHMSMQLKQTIHFKRDKGPNVTILLMDLNF